MKLAIISLAAATAALSVAALSTTALAAKVSPLGDPPESGTGLTGAQCFRKHDMRNHTVVDNKTMLVDVRGQGVYRLTMRGACLSGATNSDPIITRNRTGSDIACRPIDFDIAGTQHGFASHCIVDSVVKLTPEQLAAVPPKLKP